MKTVPATSTLAAADSRITTVASQDGGYRRTRPEWVLFRFYFVLTLTR
jgi:hypothetical protein